MGRFVEHLVVEGQEEEDLLLAGLLRLYVSMLDDVALLLGRHRLAHCLVQQLPQRLDRACWLSVAG